MQNAACTVVEALSGKSFVNNLFGKALIDNSLGARWLFPEPKELKVVPRVCKYEILDDDWKDVGLNEEQRVSTRSIILVCVCFFLMRGSPPFLLLLCINLPFHFS
jgi:hypothetical protein